MKNLQKIALSVTGLSAIGLATYYFIRKTKKRNMTLHQHLDQFLENYTKEKNINNLQIYHQKLNLIIMKYYKSLIDTTPQFIEERQLICRKILKVNDVFYSCEECSLIDNEARNNFRDEKKEKKPVSLAICEPCFLKCSEKHKNHKTERKKCTNFGMVSCDCGDSQYMDEEGFCEDHEGVNEQQIKEDIESISEERIEKLESFLFEAFFLIVRAYELAKDNAEMYTNHANSLAKHILQSLIAIQKNYLPLQYFFANFLLKKFSDYKEFSEEGKNSEEYFFTHKCEGATLKEILDKLVDEEKPIYECTCNMYEVLLMYTPWQSTEIQKLLMDLFKDLMLLNSDFRYQLPVSITTKIKSLFFIQQIIREVAGSNPNQRNQETTLSYVQISQVAKLLQFYEMEDNMLRLIGVCKDQMVNHLEAFMYMFKLAISKNMLPYQYETLLLEQGNYWGMYQYEKSAELILSQKNNIPTLFNYLYILEGQQIEGIQDLQQFIQFVATKLQNLLIVKIFDAQIKDLQQNLMSTVETHPQKEEIVEQMIKEFNDRWEKLQLVEVSSMSDADKVKKTLYSFNILSCLTQIVPLYTTYFLKDFPTKENFKALLQNSFFREYQEDDQFYKQIKKFQKTCDQRLFSGFRAKLLSVLDNNTLRDPQLISTFKTYLSLNINAKNATYDLDQVNQQMLILFEKETQYMRETYLGPIFLFFRLYADNWDNVDPLGKTQSICTLYAFLELLLDDSPFFNSVANYQHQKLPNMDKDQQFQQDQFVVKHIINQLQNGPAYLKDIQHNCEPYINMTSQVKEYLYQVSTYDPDTEQYTLKQEYQYTFYPIEMVRNFGEMQKQNKIFKQKYDQMLKNQNVKIDLQYFIENPDNALNFFFVTSAQDLTQVRFMRQNWSYVLLTEESVRDIKECMFMSGLYKNKDDSIIYIGILFVQMILEVIEDSQLDKSQAAINEFYKLYVEDNDFIDRLDVLIEFYKPLDQTYVSVQYQLYLLQNKLKTLQKERQDINEIQKID